MTSVTADDVLPAEQPDSSFTVRQSRALPVLMLVANGKGGRIGHGSVSELHESTQPSVDADVSGWAVVRLHGEQDGLEAKRRRAALQDGVVLGGGRLVVDLSEVTFGDSSLLGALVGAVKAARRRGCTVRVVTADERMRRKFVVTGLDRVFRVFSTLPEALEGLS